MLTTTIYDRMIKRQGSQKQHSLFYQVRYWNTIKFDKSYASISQRRREPIVYRVLFCCLFLFHNTNNNNTTTSFSPS